ncbi:archease [Tundrisphaera sp. TA3]|uniref:archease n=1 Tax=Tundrisphaera sp. TA3 TaxID=3435775 RepID=UPI003EC1253D
MGSIEVFDHTADVGLRIRAEDRDDLFRTAAEGVFDYIVANREAVRPEVAEAIELAAEDVGELLAVWLNELIFRSETRHRLYGRFDVRVAADGLSLAARIEGEPLDRDRHILDHEVKAVTRHGLELRRDGDGWLAEIILDI